MNNDTKPLTGIRKRVQIANANKQMFIWVAAAAVAIAVCVVLAINFGQRIIYQLKVNDQISSTSKILSDNVATVDGLMTEVDKLSSNQALNLANLKADDSTSFQVVLDALPTEDDRVSLGASLQQKVLASSGVTIAQIAVTSSGSGMANTNVTGSNVKPTARPIAFSVVLNGNYNAIQQALKDIERTIRPIVITSINLQGTDDNLQATIGAITYYVPKIDWQTGQKTVPVDNETTNAGAVGGAV